MNKVFRILRENNNSIENFISKWNMIRQHWSNDLLEKIIFQRVYAPLYTCSWRKKRNSSFQNLRDGHVDQLGVGFRHGQGGHATAVPSERGERKRHPHSPGISSRQPRGHLGRNEDSVVVHVSLSLSLSHELYRSPLPIDFTPRFTSFATNGTFKIEDSSSEFLPLSSYSLHFVLSRAGRRESLIPWS